MKSLFYILLLVLIPSLVFPATLPIGERFYGPFPIADDVRVFSFNIDRRQWPNPTVTLKVKITFAGTFIGRIRWTGCEFTSKGGRRTKDISDYNCPVPPGTQRTVSVVATVAGGPLTTGIDPTFTTSAGGR